jgi:hypothetical protein
MAMPAIEVATNDAQPDRNWPSTSRERARMMMSRMSGGAVSPLKIADSYRALIGLTPSPTRASPIVIDATITP